MVRLDIFQYTNLLILLKRQGPLPAHKAFEETPPGRRNRLQKEIWEDEAIIVGRSLDVFISKLRRKLENDSTVKVVNIHGKGYKLEISS